MADPLKPRELEMARRQHHRKFQRSRYCHYCDEMSLAERQQLNIPLHLLLTLLTCGLWLPVFIILNTVGTYRCQRCGSKV